ncbi:MAG: hypothetical protein AB7V56_05465 [Candidatus Nitrosocosmicus sp.]|nr:hypothetical protein [Candidatus Nitrosocosmicus sp.]
MQSDKNYTITGLRKQLDVAFVAFISAFRLKIQLAYGVYRYYTGFEIKSIR